MKASLVTVLVNEVGTEPAVSSSAVLEVVEGEEVGGDSLQLADIHATGTRDL